SLHTENQSQVTEDETECQIRRAGAYPRVMTPTRIPDRMTSQRRRLPPPRSPDRRTPEGRRLPRQRVIVAEALAAAKRALSAQELYERIQATHPTLGRATVYRALEAQVQDGMASRFERDGHVSAYIACDAEHHHHLVCRL